MELSLKIRAFNAQIKVKMIVDYINNLNKKFFLARQTMKSIAPYIKQGDSVLDIGCGSGFAAALLKKKTGLNVNGIDIIDCHNGEFPFQKFDGVNIPFPDKFFDVSYLAYVLHHVGDPLTLLKETARVTKRTLLIMEDTPSYHFDKFILKSHEWGFNKLYNLNDKTFFRTSEEWQGMFIKLGLKNINHVKISRLSRGIQYPISRTLFIINN